MKIKLTQGRVAKVDAEDYEWLSQHKWCLHNEGYAVRYVKRQAILMHRSVLEHHGTPMLGRQTDHRNRDRLDNRRRNLRTATHGENMCNKSRQKNNSSGYIGVRWRPDSKKWRADIGVKGRSICLGGFTNLIQAAQAYDTAALELHGEFATLNFEEHRP